MRKLLPAVALLTFTACGGDEPATPLSAGAGGSTSATGGSGTSAGGTSTAGAGGSTAGKGGAPGGSGGSTGGSGGSTGGSGGSMGGSGGATGGSGGATGGSGGATGGSGGATGGSGGATGGSGGVADAPSATDIKHVVVIIQENHTFDNHFGRYCTAPTGSNPTCTTGGACCEAAPMNDPGTGNPIGVLDDVANGARDPSHTQACELAEMNGGKMDMYATAMGCGNPGNVLVGDAKTMQPYWDLAAQGALADRYFQPIVGQSSSNDMYFAAAKFVFKDNDFTPASIGASCGFSKKPMDFTGPTIADLLVGANVPWAMYMEGYQAMADAVAAGTCPDKPAECGAPFKFYPCTFDPSDNPFAYYPSVRDKPSSMKDYTRLATDLTGGALPAVTFVRAIGYRSEHPNYKATISDGQKFVKSTLDAITASPYAASTLVILTYDEGGGFFDHVAPPPTSTVDNQPYGTRVPTLALGPFARKNAISHVTLEHSSIVKFIEWNWLGKTTGQLNGRDAVVANLGSLIDPAQNVPEN
jgi:phospholipase C